MQISIKIPFLSNIQIDRTSIKGSLLPMLTDLYLSPIHCCPVGEYPCSLLPPTVLQLSFSPIIVKTSSMLVPIGVSFKISPLIRFSDFSNGFANVITTSVKAITHTDINTKITFFFIFPPLMTKTISRNLSFFPAWSVNALGKFRIKFNST